MGGGAAEAVKADAAFAIVNSFAERPSFQEIRGLEPRGRRLPRGPHCPRWPDCRPLSLFRQATLRWRFSDLALLDAHFYVQVRSIDQPA